MLLATDKISRNGALPLVCRVGAIRNSHGGAGGPPGARPIGAACSQAWAAADAQRASGRNAAQLQRP